MIACMIVVYEADVIYVMCEHSILFTVFIGKVK